jgi:septal ring factor EnvC (AmiA/AmiB activator)
MTEQSNYWNGHLGKIALALLAVALVAILGIYESIPLKQRNTAVAAAAPDPTAQAIRDLQTSQQQAIDQLKGLQQTVSAGQVETRRLSEELTDLTRKLEALQQSFASAQRTPEPAEPAKQTQTPDNTEPPLSPSYGAGRVAGAAPFHGLSGATRSRPPHGSRAATRRRLPAALTP